MHLGLLAASVILGGTGQPKMPDPNMVTSVKRVYQWFFVPGGGLGPVPTPFIVMLPVSKGDLAKFVRSAKLRQELHIIIETDSAEKTQNLTNALIEGMRQIVADSGEIATGLETTASVPAAACKTSKSDPKQVIDPVVTGF